jgi:putative flippase GtrA
MLITLINFKHKVRRSHLVELTCFGMIGLLNTAITYGLYNLFLYFEINYLASYSIAFILSILNAYWLNGKFVFSKKKRNHLKSIPRIFIVYLSSLLFGNLILFIAVDIFKVNPIFAPFFVFLFTFPFNFFTNKYWVFK